jgi:predicted phage terminase large subunit-like protein
MATSAALKTSLRQLPPLSAIRAEITRRAVERDADGIRARCATLAGFVREAWHVLEPNARYVHNWHIDALCAHLEAVTAGKINRLLVNVWPGSSKSLIVSVMWQAWEWGPQNLRSNRFLATAFNDGPVKRDTRKCRDLILSQWYQSLWPMILPRTAEMSFANDSTGTREGVAFGSLTSQRGDRLIIDDPHSTETAESVLERQATTRKFREGALNRLNDQEKSAIVVIMQRLHEEDVSGVILKMGMGFVHLCLPMEFEADRRARTPIGFIDPRQYDGELADPMRFPREVVDGLKRDMGDYAFAGQYQQRPAPREGGLFKRAHFDGRFIDTAPPDTRWVRHWDLAASLKKTGQSNQAWTAGVKIGSSPSTKRYYVGHVVRVREEGHQVRVTIRAVAESDGRQVQISLPQDPGQAGKSQAQDLVSMLAGWNVHAQPESGDKFQRAEPFAAQCAAGNVMIVRGGWNEAYIDELCAFPSAAAKDQVDASSGAFGRLASAQIISFHVPVVHSAPRQLP